MKRPTRALPSDILGRGAHRELALDLGMVPLGGSRRGLRTVLALGQVPANIITRLTAHGLKTVRTSTIAEFVRRLSEDDYHAAIMPTEPEGIQATRVVKLGMDIEALPSDECTRAAGRHRHTPFFLLPTPDDVEFAAIIAPPDLIYYSSIEIPIAYAIAVVDVEALLRAAPS